MGSDGGVRQSFSFGRGTLWGYNFSTELSCERWRLPLKAVSRNIRFSWRRQWMIQLKGWADLLSPWRRRGGQSAFGLGYQLFMENPLSLETQPVVYMDKDSYTFRLRLAWTLRLLRILIEQWIWGHQRIGAWWTTLRTHPTPVSNWVYPCDGHEMREENSSIENIKCPNSLPNVSLRHHPETGTPRALHVCWQAPDVSLYPSWMQPGYLRGLLLNGPSFGELVLELVAKSESISFAV